MKKTIPITIASTLFYIEEDAYSKLSSYLDSVKLHFANHPGSAEIISDIEGRISEQFMENSGPGKDKIVTLKNVEDLIHTMGNVEDFNDSETDNQSKNPEESRSNQKKLFRNPDDVIIAGVASGIASYFDIDPVIVRLIFILVFFAGGSGILIYIILWLVMPMAKTSTDKLQMRGEAITLESVNHMVKEKVEEVKKNKGTLRKIISFPFMIISKILKLIGPILRKIIGFIISLFSGIAIFGITLFLAITLFNINSPYIDFPVSAILHLPQLLMAIFSVFFTIVIPVVFFLLIGITIFRNKSVINWALSLGMIGLWCLSIIILAAIGTRAIPEFKNYIDTNPAYAKTTQPFDFKDFTKIAVTDGNRIKIIEDGKFNVTAEGRANTMENVSLSVKDETLSISSPRTEKFKICIFCQNNRPEITVHIPKLSEVSIQNSSDAYIDATTTESLNVKLKNSSYANLNVDTKNLSVEETNASSIKIVGTSTNASFLLSNGSVANAKNLNIKNLNVTAENASTARVNVTQKLDVSLRNGSSVLYLGNPSIIKNIDNDGSILKRLSGENQNQFIESEWSQEQ